MRCSRRNISAWTNDSRRRCKTTGSGCSSATGSGVRCGRSTKQPSPNRYRPCRRPIRGSDMATLELQGRILYLCDHPALVVPQLGGRRLRRHEAGTLRDAVSTDEITPVPILTHYDDTLGRFPYTGFEVGGTRPIGPDAVRNGGFSV